MAIRARLKNKLKKMLGRDQDRQDTAAAPSQAYSPPPQSKPTLQPEAPSLVVSAPQEEPQIKEEKEEEPIALEEEPQGLEEEAQAAPSETAAKPEEIPEEAVVSAQKEETEPLESIAADQNTTQNTTQNTDGATYVFEITNLFPESCPSCEESSRNNWFWKDGAFACGSCEEHY